MPVAFTLWFDPDAFTHIGPDGPRVRMHVLTMVAMLFAAVLFCSCTRKQTVSFDTVATFVAVDDIHGLKALKSSNMVDEFKDIELTARLGWTILHTAAEHNSVKCAEYLLAQGVPIDGKTKEVSTPLLVALMHKNVEIAELLIARGADVNYSIPYYEASVLHVAAYNDMADIILRMLDKGAVINRLDIGCQTPLHRAATMNSYRTVAILTEKGAVLWSKDARGMTPYDIATTKGYTNLFEDLKFSDRYLDGLFRDEADRGQTK